jgi:hypothetical protein
MCPFPLLRSGSVLALAAVAFTVTPAGLPQEPGGSARCVKVAGSLLTPSGTEWKAIKAGAAVPMDAPLVSLFDSTVTSANGNVTLRLVADPAERGPLPILESAVIVHADAKHDLALTPMRGLMVLTNTRKDGPATVRFTTRGDFVDLTLKEPGTRLAVEIFSRHAPGVPHLDDPKQDDPVKHLFAIVLTGEVFLKAKAHSIALHAPPGPAVLVWDSLVREPEIRRLDALPGDLQAMKDKEQKLLDECCAWARTIDGAMPQTAFKAGLGSPDATVRKAAVTAMGALDDVRGLFQVLATSPHADARDQAVLALRQWLGREPGQTQRLHAGLQKAGLTEVQSQNVLHLLYGFTPEQQRDPATYDLLIDDLKCHRPALRALAHWHLVRMAPAGKSITYDPQAAEAERERMFEQWRKLIPAGKLPPAGPSNP